MKKVVNFSEVKDGEEFVDVGSGISFRKEGSIAITFCTAHIQCEVDRVTRFRELKFGSFFERIDGVGNIYMKRRNGGAVVVRCTSESSCMDTAYELTPEQCEELIGEVIPAKL